jgi:hypothetical protein
MEFPKDAYTLDKFHDVITKTVTKSLNSVTKRIVAPYDES